MDKKSAIEYAIEYYPKGMTLAQISKVTGMNPATIRNNLLKHNVHVRSVQEVADMKKSELARITQSKLIQYKKREINIDIKVPDDDISIICQESNLYECIVKIGGIYKFYNAKNELMYIGKAKSLPDRISQHINGKSNTSDICHNFNRVSCIYIDDEFTRSIVEQYLINTLKPKLNVEYVNTYKTSRYSSEFKAV